VSNFCIHVFAARHRNSNSMPALIIYFMAVAYYLVNAWGCTARESWVEPFKCDFMPTRREVLTEDHICGPLCALMENSIFMSCIVYLISFRRVNFFKLVSFKFTYYECSKPYCCFAARLAHNSVVRMHIFNYSKFTNL